MSTLLFLLALLGSSCSQAVVGSSGDDGSSAVVGPFLASLLKVIESADKAAVSGLFSDQFLFRGCRGDYNKEKIVRLLTSIPAGTNLSIDLVSSKFFQQDIKYHVKASGFGPSTVDADFLMRKENGKLVLIGGGIPQCTKPLPSSRSFSWHGRPEDPTYYPLILDGDEGLLGRNVVRFMYAFRSAIRLADPDYIGEFLLDTFKLRLKCKRYNKATTIRFLSTYRVEIFSQEIDFYSIKGNHTNVEYIANAIENPLPIYPFQVKCVLEKHGGRYIMSSATAGECRRGRPFLD